MRGQDRLDAVLDMTDGSDVEVMNGGNFIGQYEFRIVRRLRNPKHFRRNVKSISGQGNDLQQCEEIDSEHFYIPKSGNCL